MPPRAQRSLSFVDRHDLWSAEQRRAAAAVEREIKRRKLEVIRFAFCDQHGVLRGKTLVASEAAKAMRAGVTMTSTLLAKDTSHRTVFPVFSAGGGMGLDEMAGAGNFVMVADPGDLPRAAVGQQHRLDAVRHLFPERQAGAVLDAGALSRRAGASSANAGFDFFAGLEVEFQLFKLLDPKLSPDGLTWPAEAPAVEHTTHGFQYLTESRFDQVDPILEVLRKTMQALGMPLLSLEVELGPSQYEFTFAPEEGPRGRRHHGAVPQRHEAGGAAARLSRELHVPAEIAQHVRQRLASAPVAAGSQIGQEPVRLQRQDRAALAARPALSRRPAGACARGGGVHHADHQRLQALSRHQLDGADPGDLGARTIAA